MSNTATATAAAVDNASLLAEDVRSALRDLILVLADTKRLLGIRYSDWMLGAPTLESGISASSMAQDEWGHGRLTYALLSDFGENPKELEHEREADAYRSAEVLDQPFASWAELIAVQLLLDTALSIQYSALQDSRYTPVHNRVQKLLDEERFHFQHACGWTRRLAASPAIRDELQAALSRLLPVALRWLGREEADSTRRLVEDGVVREGPDALRARFLDSVGRILDEAGLAEPVGLARRDGSWTYAQDLDWSGWNDATRRAGGTGPDDETLARVRGDRNRAFLMD